MTHFELGEVERLETWIDRYHLQLPKLTRFILPVSNLFPYTSIYMFLFTNVCMWREGIIIT